MPSQSYEYLGKKMLESYSIDSPKSNQLYTRLAMINGNVDSKIDNLLKDIFTKNFTKLYLNKTTITSQDIEDNIKTNTDIFEQLYARHLDK
jgi:hypothetical protein